MSETPHAASVLWPTRCVDVTYDLGDEESLSAVTGPHTGLSDWDVGDLVWNPKMGEGHVLTGTRECGPDWYCGYCGQWDGGCGTWVRCECGDFDPGDHHGYLLARRPK